MRFKFSSSWSVCLIFILFSVLLACDDIAVSEKSSMTSDIHLDEITISELHQGYLDGKYTVTEIVKAYMQRIDSIDRNGPGLNAIIAINPEAMEIAARLDQELAEGKVRGPLHGIPVILKDNIDTQDKMANTAGATALRNSYPGADSWVAKKLRDAGAVILGKANLSEWANFRASFSSSGWSGVGGQTRNPYVLDRNPCGSSSGSGVAVSANLCAFAIGTETDGSIVCPANNNGIVGLKPTVGLISRSGIIPISFSQDTPGPMCRTVEDAAIALGAMTGIDPADSKTLASEGKTHADYSQFLDPDGLAGKRIGLMKGSMGYHYKTDTLFMEAVAFMKSRGAEVIEFEYDIPPEMSEASFQVLLYEFKDGLNAYFRNLGQTAPVNSLEELIGFNRTDSIELHYFDQKLLEMAQAKGGLESPEYKHAVELIRQKTRDGIDKLMDDHKLDALIMPTGTPAWKTDLVNGDHYMGGNSSLAAIPGYPSISVPMGFVDELPVGISFIGRAWSEPLLIAIAYSFEQGTKVRKAPKYFATDPIYQ